MQPIRGREQLDELYLAAYPRLVRVVGVIAGDRQEAEEAVQEAFVRLLGRWDSVRRYDDPEAWVRKVAVRQLSNRRRKLRNGQAALARAAGSSAPAALAEPGPDGDLVDLRRALAQLPLEQRQALVLHHLVGLDVRTVARELDVPVGTVKARLSRGRAALAPLLQEDTHDHV